MFKKKLALLLAALCIVPNALLADFKSDTNYSKLSNEFQAEVGLEYYKSILHSEECRLRSSDSSRYTNISSERVSDSSCLSVRSVAVSRQLESALSQPDSALFQQDSTLHLEKIIVSAGLENTKRSPLRLKTVDKNFISSMAPGKTFPELIGGSPGIYATSESGSYGDAKINIRGYKQENISVLLNGIPISGLTSSGMYWNNWMGLADATAKIQVQKGIGASMLSDNSVGGTINIITTDPVETRQLGGGYYMSDYGIKKSYLSYSSGPLNGGWALAAMASYVWGRGNVEATDVNSFAYLFSVSKRVGRHNSFNFTALGSPERHQQRSYRLSYSDMEQYGVNYNKNWGYYKGKKKTLAENNYFKPYFTLSHLYKTALGGGKGGDESANGGDISLTLSTTEYLAIGDGGGLYPEYTDKEHQIITFIKEGHIDWQAVEVYNRDDSAVAGENTAGTEVQGNAPKNIISDYIAGHTQFGIKSSVALDFSKKVHLEGGIHWQKYDKWEKERIKDLLGADYWYEDYANNSIAGLVGRDPYKKVGDYIRTYNGQNIDYFTFYLSGNLYLDKRSKFLLTAGASLSTSYIKRWDRYNYVSDVYSDMAHGVGGSFKAGLLYKLNNANSFYLNGGIYSRAPYPNLFFATGKNNISRDTENEWNYLGELGYRRIGERGGFEATFYAAYWKNKSLMSNNYKPMDSNDYRYLVTGLDAFHYGIEFEAFYNIGSFLRLNSYLSHGVWLWKNDVHATIYDPYNGKPLSTLDVYSDGLHVGDAPQSQLGASADLVINKLFDNPFAHAVQMMFSADWNYNTRFWADFDPASRRDADDRSDSYRIPSFHVVNLKFKVSIPSFKGFSLFVNVNNLFHAKYIERSKDGSSHDRETFTGYWGAGRGCIAGLNVKV